MRWIKFKHLFHKSWHLKMRKFIESEECEELYRFLKSENKKGWITPTSNNLYRAFLETDLFNLKAVIIGNCPYTEFTKDNVPVADGLLFGCAITEKVHPQLDTFYRGLEKDLYDGLNLSYEKSPDVRYLAQQGVLMLNASLTTERDVLNGHLKEWEPFMKFLFEEIINVTGVPVVFLGSKSAALQKYRDVHSINYFASHPAVSSNKCAEWDTKGTFSKIDEVLLETNGTLLGVQWLDIPLPF
jgi:uracil-DNA glycosylase